MVLTINAKPIDLDQDELESFFDDLGALAADIDEMLAVRDRRKANVEALLQRLNDLVDVYS